MKPKPCKHLWRRVRATIERPDPFVDGWYTADIDAQRCTECGRERLIETFAATRAYIGDPEDEPCSRCGQSYAQHYSPDGQADAECPMRVRLA
jgi:hypothetical protein